MDWQGSDADAIGTYPVHSEWTIVDGGWESRTVRHFARNADGIGIGGVSRG